MGSVLTGHVEPVRRGWWRLVINLPSVPLLDDEGACIGRHYPKDRKLVEATGKKGATRLLEERIAKLEAHGCADPDALTVAALAEMFLEDAKRRTRPEARRHIRPKTLKFYRDYCDNHVVPVLGSTLAKDVGEAELYNLYEVRAQEGLGQTSLSAIHRTVSAMYSWGVRRHLVDRNPAKDLEDPPRPDRRDLTVWSQEDIVYAMARARGTDNRPQLVYLPLVLAAWGGLREGEVCGLQRADVDFDRGGVHVRRVIEQLAEGELHIDDTKTLASMAFEPLPEQAMTILKEHLKAQDEMRLANGPEWNPEGWVICRRDGQPVKPTNLASAWRRFCRVHSLRPIRFHDLRHSFATAIFEQGGEDKERMLKIAQLRLRHADPATTARIYLHPTEHASELALARQEDEIERAMAKIPQNSPLIRPAVSSLAAARRKKSLQSGTKGA